MTTFPGNLSLFGHLETSFFPPIILALVDTKRTIFFFLLLIHQKNWKKNVLCRRTQAPRRPASQTCWTLAGPKNHLESFQQNSVWEPFRPTTSEFLGEEPKPPLAVRSFPGNPKWRAKTEENNLWRYWRFISSPQIRKLVPRSIV